MHFRVSIQGKFSSAGKLHLVFYLMGDCEFLDFVSVSENDFILSSFKDTL